MFLLNLSRTLSLMFLLVFFVSCSDNSSQSESFNISGFAQKGPFKEGSLVQAYKLSKGERTKQTSQSLVLDDKGFYTIDIPWTGTTEIEISGEYLDETSLEYLKNGKISLIIESKKNKQLKANINILTHLRSKILISKIKENINKEFKVLNHESNTEILKMFNISNNNVKVENLNLTTLNNNINKRLLKISAVVSKNKNILMNLENIIKNKEDYTSIITNIKNEEVKINVSDLSKRLNEKLKNEANTEESKTSEDKKVEKDEKETKKIEIPKIIRTIYSKKEITNQDVKVTIILDKNVSTDDSWQKEEKFFTKTYSSNKIETIIFTDIYNNQVELTIKISNIDKISPIISDAKYSSTSSTTQAVIVTFASDDIDLLVPISWIKEGNVFKKSFQSNTNETVNFTDNAGNKVRKNILITNIYDNDAEMFTFNGKDYKKIKSSKTKRIWLDRNLGANEVCTSSNNTQCVGDYFQWGRKVNGHEKLNSKVTTTTIEEDLENNATFINNKSAPYNWRKTKDITLWTGNNSICPDGYKIPTEYELEAEFNINSQISPLNSILKIANSSFRKSSGELDKSNDSYLWTNHAKSTLISFEAKALKFDEKTTYPLLGVSKGLPVRCIQTYEDNTKPIIISIKSGLTELNDGALDISVSDLITIEFSEEIRSEDINSVNISLKRNDGSSKAVKYSNKIVTLYSFNGNLLENDKEYTLTVKSEIKDISGNTLELEKTITFQTKEVADTILPMIDYSNSTFDSSKNNIKNNNVSVHLPIVISFNEKIKEDTINKTNILINNAADYNIKINNDKKSFAITFNKNLEYETTYELFLSKNITDLLGNQLNGSNYSSAFEQDKTIEFATIPTPDTQKPTIISTTPKDTDTEVSIGSNILVVFNEEIKNYNNTNIQIIKASDNSQIRNVLSFQNKTLSINPELDLEENTSYKLIIKSENIKDLADNSLELDYEITFATSSSNTCIGVEINDICYEVSNELLKWDEAKNKCESTNKILVSKDEINNWSDFARDLNLNENQKYWLLEGATKSSSLVNYLRYSNSYPAGWSKSSEYYKNYSNVSNNYNYICKSDNSSPSIILSSPSNNENNISTKTSIKITFNEEIKNYNDNNILLFIEGSTNELAKTITYKNKILTIKPLNDFNISTKYKIILKSGISDLFSNHLIEKSFSFITSSIASTCDGYLSNDNTCYELSKTKKTWSEAKSFCKNNNKTLLPKDNIINLEILSSSLELDTSKKYWLKEEDNNYSSFLLKYQTYTPIKWIIYHDSKSYQNLFICISEKTAPTITLTSPLNNENDVSTKASIKITFDEEIKNYEDNNILLFIDGSTNELPKTITYKNKILTIKPLNDFNISTKYKVILKSGITDLYTNTLIENSFVFTTNASVTTCDGYEESGKCYYLNTSLRSSYASALCPDIKADLNWNDLATTLSLDTSKYYWISKTGSSHKTIYYKNEEWIKPFYAGYSSYASICKKE